jgi:hypothetical protein
MSNTVLNFSTSSWKEYHHLTSTFETVLQPWLESNVPEFLTLFHWDYTGKTVYFRSNAHRWGSSKVSIDKYNPSKAIILKRGVDIVLDDILLKKFQVAVENDIKLSELVKSKDNWKDVVRDSVKVLKGHLIDRGVDVKVEFDYYSDIPSIDVYNSYAKVRIHRDMRRDGYKPSPKTRDRIDIGSTLVEVERKLELFRADAAILEENIQFIMDNICPEFWYNNN